MKAPKAKRNSPTGAATRAHIMDVAEVLFSETGPASVSVRDIAHRAEVNLAAVNYHFGSKENLFKEVFERSIRPLNAERMALLDDALAIPRSDDGLRAILYAFNAPLYRLASDSQEKARLLVVARYLHEAFATLEGGRAVIAEFYEPVRHAFVLALHDARRDLSLEEVVWRYNSMVGMSLYALGGLERLSAAPSALTAILPEPLFHCDDQALEWSLWFLEAGFRAPATARQA